jgi:hypothetical protein
VDGRVDFIGSTTVNLTSGAAVEAEHWGNLNFSEGSEGFGESGQGKLERCAFWAGTAMTGEEVDRFLITGKSAVKPDLWHEYDTPSLEDKSGNGHNGTATGTMPVADHPPVTGPFKNYKRRIDYRGEPDVRDVVVF